MRLKNSKEKTIENVVRELGRYFKSVDIRDRQPTKWKVPIGGSFFDEKELALVLDCYLTGSFSTQVKVGEFEKSFADYCGVKHGVAVNSGSSANLIALTVLMETGELKKGDEVIVPATTFITVATPIVQLGLTPVYVDVDPHTFNLDPDSFEKAIVKGKTKAVMVVHTLGCPADMGRIMPIARKYKLKVIEDCCEAHGAEYAGKKVGSFADLSTFSFYVAHHITTGEGGMILTNSKKYEQIAREVKEFGRKKYSVKRYGFSDNNLSNFDERYVFNRLGYNMRMSDIQAAFGLMQVKRLNGLNKKRIAIATYYNQYLSEKTKANLELPSSKLDNMVHTYYTYPMLLKKNSKADRKELAHYLESHGVETRAIMCGTLPDQPCLSKAPGRNASDLKVSRYIRDRGLFIGSHPGLRKQDLEHAVNMLNKYFEKM